MNNDIELLQAINFAGITPGNKIHSACNMREQGHQASQERTDSGPITYFNLELAETERTLYEIFLIFGERIARGFTPCGNCQLRDDFGCKVRQFKRSNGNVLIFPNSTLPE